MLISKVGPIWAAPRVKLTVQIVLASQGTSFVDPSLSVLAQKLQSVFRYSSYRLLGRKRLTLNIGETAAISIPGKRVLNVTPERIVGNRIELRIRVFKKRRQTIHTVIHLLFKGNIVVGGPEYKGGVLLFNIANL